MVGRSRLTLGKFPENQKLHRYWGQISKSTDSMFAKKIIGGKVLQKMAARIVVVERLVLRRNISDQLLKNSLIC